MKALHRPIPRSLDLDEEHDPRRAFRCRVCGLEGDFDDLYGTPCPQEAFDFGDAA